MKVRKSLEERRYKGIIDAQSLLEKILLKRPTKERLSRLNTNMLYISQNLEKIENKEESKRLSENQSLISERLKDYKV